MKVDRDYASFDFEFINFLLAIMGVVFSRPPMPRMAFYCFEYSSSLALRIDSSICMSIDWLKFEDLIVCARWV